MKRVPIFVLAVALAARMTAAQGSEPRPVAGNPEPRFPTTAVADAVIGYVDLEIDVRKDGRAGSVRVVNSAPKGWFEKAARDTAKQWRFEPTTDARGSARTFTTRMNFRPAGPAPLRVWHSAIGARVAYPGGLIQLKGGWIHTLRWFSDFALEVEYRVVEDRTVAGILIHAQHVGAEGDRVAYRVNLTDAVDGTVTLGRIDGGQLTSREISFDQAAAAAAARPIGTWRKLRVESSNGRVQVTTNGVLLSAFDQLTRRAGHIGIEVDRGTLEVGLVSVERRDPHLSGTGPFSKSVTRDTAPGITPPRLLREIKPDYSVESMRTRTQGLVKLEGIVLPDGSMGALTVLKSLDLDLDQAAVAAVRQWLFAPGLRNGEAVPVLVQVEMSFTLK
jgi:TonB family protein